MSPAMKAEGTVLRRESPGDPLQPPLPPGTAAPGFQRVAISVGLAALVLQEAAISLAALQPVQQLLASAKQPPTVCRGAYGCAVSTMGNAKTGAPGWDFLHRRGTRPDLAPGDRVATLDIRSLSSRKNRPLP